MCAVAHGIFGMPAGELVAASHTGQVVTAVSAACCAPLHHYNVGS
jgi:hypothetical protein